VHHAALLAEELRRCEVRADYVASYRPDGSDGDPMDIIRQFREQQLDVLVNVQMVTEGVDVPGIQTVFLTRPTTSEILMRQMIGRALRGPAVGGSEKAYLVSFEDHWEKFREWDSMFDLVPDIEAVADIAAPEAEQVPIIDRFQEYLPWGVIRATAASLRPRFVEHKADAFEAIPDGWLVLERDDEDESLRAPIAMYQHQRPCWDALVAHLWGLDPHSLEEANVDALYDEFFADCDVPAPSQHLVGMVVQHRARGGARPEYHDLAARRECDPHEVAKRIHDGDLGHRKKTDLIERSYDAALARAIYPTLREYHAAVEDALYELDYPDEATRPVRAIPVFEPRPEDQLAPGPAHDLGALMTEVLATGASLLAVPKLELHGTLEWSRRILKGWGGMTYYQENPPRIRINRLLDSPDIRVTTIRFLLWHEFLHVHLVSGHTKTFREYERRWPGYVEADRELDTLNERFGVEYW